MNVRVSAPCWLIPTALVFAACDSDTLSRQMERPDSGVVFPDAEPPPDPPDAGFAPDASAPDASAPDAEPAPAVEPIYIHTGETLYSYDPDTNRAMVIGNFHRGGTEITTMVDIAIDLQGRMFGGTTQREIFRVNALTAECTFLSTYDDILHGLTFVSDGRLVVAGRRVSIVDPSTGNMIREVVPEGVYETSGDIVGLPDGKLYWSVRGGQGMGDALIQIDPDTGVTRYQGQGSVQALYGLGFAYDVLYGFSRDGVAVTLDRQSGGVLDTKALSGRWYGATTNPVLW